MSFNKKQKVLFTILGGSLCFLLIVGGYVIVDQAVTITYMRDGYNMIEDELAVIISIFNDTDRSKNKIEKRLKCYPAFEGMDFSGDTVQMYQHELIFSNGTLLKIDTID
ncbi:hypothetical protein SAMN05216327_101505 [Dyadobacter sp. SG02]|uniref:hypothetical protein n=1 Tax=Dyadobacter sp. SG02 TaxID=1855291 RepID=UPI0008D2AEEF|nr:hypothetical protein [Dyadobacter sp. SG02]SEI43168.1 hypothetical protein SAMN05216327_101505 [Dyadobacter sp. SG02]